MHEELMLARITRLEQQNEVLLGMLLRNVVTQGTSGSLDRVLDTLHQKGIRPSFDMLEQYIQADQPASGGIGTIA